MTLEAHADQSRPDQRRSCGSCSTRRPAAGAFASTASSSSRSTRRGTIQEAMEKQMRAERDRRAAILTAEGVEAVADPHRRGREAVRRPARRGRRKTAAILRAEGEAKAIDTVFEAIHEGRPDRELLSYQYLQMLPQLAAGRREQGLRRSRRSSPRRSAASARRSPAAGRAGRWPPRREPSGAAARGRGPSAARRDRGARARRRCSLGSRCSTRSPRSSRAPSATSATAAR